MNTINNIILAALPDLNNVRSVADKQLITEFINSIIKTEKEYMTIELAILNTISFAAVALRKSNRRSNTYVLFNNIIVYLDGLMTARMNLGGINMTNINELTQTLQHLPLIRSKIFLDKSKVSVPYPEIETISKMVDGFKYMKYKNNKLIVDLHKWMRYAIDWSIKQKQFYITIDGHHYIVEVNDNEDKPYKYTSSNGSVVEIDFDYILKITQQYMIDLFYSFTGKKFYQINLKRLCVEENTVSDYYPIITEETDMTRLNENRLTGVWIKSQPNCVNRSAKQYISGIYSDKEKPTGIKIDHKYDKKYTGSSETSIYRSKNIDNKNEIKEYSITRHDSEIEFAGKRYYIWYEYSLKTSQLIEVSHAATKEKVNVLYTRCLKLQDKVYIVEASKTSSIIDTHQYPQLTQHTVTEKNLYKATELKELKNNDNLFGAWNKTEVTITKPFEKDSHIDSKPSVEWHYKNIIDMDVSEFEDDEYMTKKGEELIFEFEKPLTQIPEVILYGFLYDPMQPNKFLDKIEEDPVPEITNEVRDRGFIISPLVRQIMPNYMP